MVFARTDPQAPPGKGIGVFIVPARCPGSDRAARDHKMGQCGAWTADVSFDGVRVPADALVGAAAAAGYSTAMRSLAHGRLLIAAMCVGVMARLIDESVPTPANAPRAATRSPTTNCPGHAGRLADRVHGGPRAGARRRGPVRRGHRPAARPVGGQVLRQRGGRPGRRPRRADPRRCGVHARRAGGASSTATCGCSASTRAPARSSSWSSPGRCCGSCARVVG